MTTLEVNIFLFALWALCISPSYIRRFAERLRAEHGWALQPGSDGCRVALLAVAGGVVIPFVYLNAIHDELADPTQIHPAPWWAVLVVVFGCVTFLLAWGIRVGRFVRALLRSRR